MKKLIGVIALCILIAGTGCKRIFADYEERRESCKKVCPTCTPLVLSQHVYYISDTAHQPNIVYQVIFRSGGLYYKASDIDHLVRIN